MELGKKTMDYYGTARGRRETKGGKGDQKTMLLMTMQHKRVVVMQRTGQCSTRHGERGKCDDLRVEELRRGGWTGGEWEA